MRNSLTKSRHIVVALALAVWAGGCTVRERKVELQGSTPTLQISDVKRGRAPAAGRAKALVKSPAADERKGTGQS